jgi:integrase
LTEESKNLATVETQNSEKAAEATTSDQATIKGKLVELAFWMNKEGFREATIKGRTAIIRRLANLGADLWNPETVKETIAKQKTWGDGQKVGAVTAYNTFLEMEKMTWKPPKYRYQAKLPFIPTEAELDQLIIACGKRTGTFLQGLKDTGADPGELGAIRWIDINNEARTVAINYPVKNHNPRILSVSDTFIKRVNMLPKNSERIFKIKGVQSGFYNQQRKTAAYKLGNPRLLKVSFITFRHWKGTMEYHRTKDILHVKRILGHKSIQNTLVYIDLEANIFTRPNEEFTARVATNTKEACQLIEVGFEYVTGDYLDGGKIFRKRK